MTNTNQILRDALTDIAGTKNRTATEAQFIRHLQKVAADALTATGAAEAPKARYQVQQNGFASMWCDVLKEVYDACESPKRTLYTAPPSPTPAALAEMEARKDAAYYERNQVVAALAQCFPSGKARTAIEGWSEDWHGCVYIDLPTGQVSWHYHDSHAHLFNSLPHYLSAWDGHDTAEKYRRVAALRPTPAAEEVTGAAVRDAALEEAAMACEARRPASREDCPEHWKHYEKSWSLRLLVADECATAIRALKS